MPFGVAPAAIQEMMPNRMRAQASAVYLFVVNLIGLGVGPTAVAFMTENVFKDVEGDSIRYSMAIVSTVAGLVATVLLYIAMMQFRHSLKRLKDWHGEPGA
jgi:spore maturation protein SpmA